MVRSESRFVNAVGELGVRGQVMMPCARDGRISRQFQCPGLHVIKVAMNSRTTIHGDVAIARDTDIAENIGRACKLVDRIGLVNAAAKRKGAPAQQVTHFREQAGVSQICLRS